MTSWVEISSERLGANYRTLCGAAGDAVSVLAVIKADAYGHGAGLCAPVLARAGAAWLGVTDAAEGAEVRAALAEAGIAPERQPRILVMSGLANGDAATVVAQGLTPVIWTVEQMERLAVAAAQADGPLAVHLEIDTGMARQGAAVGAELDAALGWLRRQSSIVLDGVMTHLASAEVAGSHQTAAQQQQFEQALAQVAAAGLRPEWVHAGNTSAIDNAAAGADGESAMVWLARVAAQAGARAMVRAGLGLYGYCLPIERERGFTGAAEHVARPRLEPVMTWKARVIGVREIAAGEQVGYNGIFTAQSPMRLALVPVGYADGLRRGLSAAAPCAGGWVMVNGRQAPMVGRVSMNLTIVDVTALGEVSVGDEAVVLGEGVTAEDHARLTGTIAYEILCGVKARRLLV